MGILGCNREHGESVMTLENREHTNFSFLNLINDPVVSNEDFPDVLATDLGNDPARARLLCGSTCASPETL